MKSFKQYITEDDIMGGYDYNSTSRISRRRKGSLIPNLNALVAKIGKVYAPTETTQTLKLDDDHHIHIDHDKELGRMSVRLMSSKPGHEKSPLMTYHASHAPQETISTPDGKKVEMYSGTPQKAKTDVRRGVVKVPKNFFHAIVNATGVGIMSGGSQTKGGVNMWRKAVRHGHETGHSVESIHEIGPRFASSYQMIGRITPRNFQDAYNLDVSTRKKGNTSSVPRMFNHIDPENPKHRPGVTRVFTRLVVLPKKESIQ